MRLRQAQDRLDTTLTDRATSVIDRFQSAGDKIYNAVTVDGEALVNRLGKRAEEIVDLVSNQADIDHRRIERAAEIVNTALEARSKAVIEHLGQTGQTVARAMSSRAAGGAERPRLRRRPARRSRPLGRRVARAADQRGGDDPCRRQPAAGGNRSRR